MGKIIYHNIVYQYLHTRTQHKCDMVLEKDKEKPIFKSNNENNVFFFFWENSIIFLSLRVDGVIWKLGQRILKIFRHSNVIGAKTQEFVG